jgi:Fe-S-cluster containining protein
MSRACRAVARLVADARRAKLPLLSTKYKARSTNKTMSEELRDKVLEIYREADREVERAGPVCLASGRCCRFKEYGHVLFVSNLEAEVLLAGAPPYAKPVSADFCPFQKENLCTAREPRPLACRVYYCDPSYQDTAGQITEKYLKQLKALADAEGLEWRYAPLHHFLG